MTQSESTEARATRSRTTFRMEVAVAVDVRATAAAVWKLLTDAADFPRWNSTVQGIEGTIAEGETIRVRATVAPERVFKLKVTDVAPRERMTWSDSMGPMFKGVRTFTLTEKAEGVTTFAMREVFSGIMLPMIAGSLPDFGPIFETYAADLKREAERATA